MTAGRPTKYEPWMLDKVLELMAQGASKVEVAVALGINRDTLNEWSKHIAEFSDTIKRGEDLSQVFWEKLGRSGVTDRSFNTPVWIYNMKNRFRKDWSDKQIIAHTSAGLDDLTDEELNIIQTTIGREISDNNVNDNL